MSETVERVVKSMKDRLASDDEVYFGDDGDVCVVDGHVDMVALARAAIREMREPTGKMVKATPFPHNTAGSTAVVYRAMIDAALAP